MCHGHSAQSGTDLQVVQSCEAGDRRWTIYLPRLTVAAKTIAVAPTELKSISVLRAGTELISLFLLDQRNSRDWRSANLVARRLVSQPAVVRAK